MFLILYAVLFFAIPVILIVLYCVSLYHYVSAKKKNKTAPGTFTDDEIKKRKKMLLVLSVAAGVLVAVVIGFSVLLSMCIAHM